MRLVPLFLASAALAVVSVAAPTQVQPAAQPEKAPDARKLLADPSPQARLRGALELSAQFDEQAIGVLIDLLAELPAGDRLKAEQALRQLAGEWSPNPPLRGEDELSRKIRREVWASWWKTVNGPALLAAFRQRTLSAGEAAAARKLIDQLGDESAAKRDKAGADLTALGAKVVGLLRAAKSPDDEHARRVAACLQEIARNGGQPRLPLAAPGLLAARKPPGAAAALLAYLPDADNASMKNEITRALTSLVRAADTVDPVVVQALGDALPLRREVAAEALAAAGGANRLAAVRPLLKDAEPGVRLRVAVALANARDRDAVPVLIALLADLPRGQVWEAEDLLQRLAGEKAPKVPYGGDDAAARQQFSAAWQAWWKEHGAAVDLAELEKTRASSGLTVVAESSMGFKKRKGEAPTGKVVAVDRTGQVRWQIENLDHPVDVQLLPGERVLVAEYYGKRVTERDSRGKILWEASLPTYPVNVQRLANGNTFIVLYGLAALGGNGQSMMEVDATGKIVATFTGPAGAAGGGGIRDLITSGYKMPDGKMVCSMYDGTVIWMDATGKEVKRFTVPQGNGGPGFALSTYGSIDVTPKGHVLLAQRDGLVVEYDADGKAVWQAKIDAYRATRIANGNTLVATINGGVVELDPTGRAVWQYTPAGGQQAMRARRP
jgi:hypothetical protein